MSIQNPVRSPAGSKLQVTPLGVRVGADISEVDLADLDDATFQLIHRAWLDHHVLRFRRQSLSKDSLLEFSRRFGALDDAPINAQGRPWIDGYPKLAVMSNIKANGASIGSLGYGEAVWHTDMSYKPETPSAALLYALEVTRSGGETGFLDMHHAYATLPEDLAAAVAGKQIKHDASRDSSGVLRKGFEAVDDPRAAPGALHPIVISHPLTGQPALFLGRRPFSYVDGLGLGESETLLDALWAHATNERHAWFQKWDVGDLLIWDNRSVMHKRTAFDPDERRYLIRTQIKGSAPSAATDARDA